MTRLGVFEARVLPEEPLLALRDYVDAGGGRGLDAARRLGPDGVVEHLAAAGLRGRGGAGFPTARKWAAVLARAAPTRPSTVVVNAAEGEPGSFKDRALLRANPFAVLEGALVAAVTVGADRVVVACKASFVTEHDLLEEAAREVEATGWAEGIALEVFGGPSEYLYGEETGLLEALQGRPPFPRVVPPYRLGVDEVGESGSPEPARAVMADDDGTDAPPTLVNNAETMANVAAIVANGPAWFREVGTDESPGTVVCTITGATRRHGVGEVPMGTPLREVIDRIGGGARPGRRVVAVMSGVANPLVLSEHLDVPASYEGMAAIGSGLGTGGFIVFDDETDFAAVAQGVSRFLAVESCGQCTPCKQDGIALSELLDRVRASDAHELDLVAIDDRLRTVADSARCALATQHQLVISSIVTQFADQLRDHVDGTRSAGDRTLVAPLVDIVDDVAVTDGAQATKQPDWTHDPVDSGKSPAGRLATASPDAVREAPTLPSAPAPSPPAAATDRPEPAEAPRHVHPGNRVRPEDVTDDPEARLYSSAPIETDEGTVVIEQQNVGPGSEEGSGAWPDPDTPPEAPAPGAA
jgi:NADH:ubiquinone oxidoreductase subunit F (NADH-binding)